MVESVMPVILGMRLDLSEDHSAQPCRVSFGVRTPGNGSEASAIAAE